MRVCAPPVSAAVPHGPLGACGVWAVWGHTGLSLAWREGVAVGSSPYLEHFKNILPVMHFLQYSLNIHVISNISPHALLFSFFVTISAGSTAQPHHTRQGMQQSRVRSWAARLSLLISSLHRFLNTSSSDRTDTKMACRSGERPTFFEIFKTRCSDSGTAWLHRTCAVKVAFWTLVFFMGLL